MRNFLLNSIKKNKYYTLNDINKVLKTYDEIIKGDKIYKPFASGNLKLSSYCLIFDLPSIITCKYACSGCYALKAERMFKNVREKRLLNLLIINEIINHGEKRDFFLDVFYKNLKSFNKVFKNPIVRIHSSGDFFNKDYFNFWIEIVETFKSIKFYTYSKQLTNREIEEINNKYKNFNIVKSLIEINNKTFLNFGTLEEIQKIKTSLEALGQKAFICDYGIQETSLKCLDGCKKCLTCSNILFKKH